MDSDSRTQSEPQVRSSELVVLLDRWNQDVIKWENAADNTEPDSWTVRDRCRARASEIARCRRELAEVIKQHNVELSDRRENKQ